MSKITDAFKNEKAFIPYIMAGDPSLDKTKEYILSMEKAGADIVEIGIPFSDPIAEGKVIQSASLRALEANTNVNKIFDMVKELKQECNIPLLFMTYLNPVFSYGYDAFLSKCVEYGISGLIIPDMPFEEEDEIIPFAKKYNIDIITLIAPTSNERIKNIAKSAQGFLYLVSSMGVTGVRSKITTDIPSIVSKIKETTDIPVAVGFGIHSPDQAARISKNADGVIVGSAIVKIIEEHKDNASSPLYEYVKSMKNAIK